jgi:hypothetical protein
MKNNKFRSLIQVDIRRDNPWVEKFPDLTRFFYKAIFISDDEIKQWCGIQGEEIAADSAESEMQARRSIFSEIAQNLRMRYADEQGLPDLEEDVEKRKTEPRSFSI